MKARRHHGLFRSATANTMLPAVTVPESSLASFDDGIACPCVRRFCQSVPRPRFCALRPRPSWRPVSHHVDASRQHAKRVHIGHKLRDISPTRVGEKFSRGGCRITKCAAPSISRCDRRAEGLVQTWLTKMNGAFKVALQIKQPRPAKRVRISDQSERKARPNQSTALRAKARARPTRCCMPPDKLADLRSAQFASPDSFSLRPCRSRAFAFGTFRQVSQPKRPSLVNALCATAVIRTAGTPSTPSLAHTGAGHGRACGTKLQSPIMHPHRSARQRFNP